MKIPWELSRFQHLTTLGEAYWLTKEEKYAYEFVNQVTDWIEHNPPKFGVNWVCTMDVAIRACNWALAWEFFKNSPSISNEFIIKFFKSLLQHGRHIKNNLEYSEILTSNHYLSDIVGLTCLGILVPEFEESEGWKEFGIQQLKTEMFKQVYLDGTDFEASTCYHRLVLEIFFYISWWAVINHKKFNGENYREVGEEIFGEEFVNRLYKMFDAVLYLLKPSGRMPQIGDNDSGQFIKLYPREVLDMRYLLALGAVFFREPRFKVREFFQTKEDIVEVIILYGEEGLEIWNNLSWNGLKGIKSKAFPDSSWYVMRDGLNYVIISCGPKGQNGSGGHAHNDKLSFELCVDGRDIIVDPGTYIYTPDPEWRNKFRSTAYHNTVVVDGEEQNGFKPNELFRMPNDAVPKVNRWESTEGYDFLDAQHRGYARLRNSAAHRRQIFFDKQSRYWIIRDTLLKEQSRGNANRYGEWGRNLDVYFHLSQVKMDILSQDTKIIAIRGMGQKPLYLAPFDSNGLFVDIYEGWVSPRYGCRQFVPILRFRKLCPDIFDSVIVLYIGFLKPKHNDTGGLILQNKKGECIPMVIPFLAYDELSNV